MSGKNQASSVWGGKFAHNLWLQLMKFINIIVITIPFSACWDLYYVGLAAGDYGWRGRLVVVLLYSVLYLIFARVYDALHVSLYRISEIIYSQTLAFLIADGLIYVVICLMAARAVNLLPGIACIGGQFILSVLWALLVHKAYFAAVPPRKTMVVYDQREGAEELIREYGMEKKFRVVGVVPAAELLADLSALTGCEAIFIIGVHSHDRNVILKYCVENDINAYIIPRIGDVIMAGARQMHIFHLPILNVSRYEPHPEYLILKRFLDIVLCAAAAAVTSPIMLVTAIAIKACDGGPVFYRQKRLTKNGKEFFVLKFRSMRVDAEKDGVARLSTGGVDPRVTKVGRVIRACRLDELPQLFNIIKGDMSIVGPRPERPEIAEQYCREFPEFNLRLQAKAGLTGYAQVYGKYNTTPRDKLTMDLMYIAHPSIWEDVKICFATVKILFMPDSTEGVEEGKTTAE